jgi:VanZ family protein
MYVPFGLCGFVSMRDRYQRYSLRLVGRVVLLALLFSAANEALQLYTIDRIASLTDVVSAVIGAMIGSGAIAVTREPRNPGRSESKRLPE